LAKPIDELEQRYDGGYVRDLTIMSKNGGHEFQELARFTEAAERYMFYKSVVDHPGA
jgi:hypothetical protein